MKKLNTSYLPYIGAFASAIVLIALIVRRVTRPLWDDYYPMRCDAGKVG